MIHNTISKSRSKYKKIEDNFLNNYKKEKVTETTRIRITPVSIEIVRQREFFMLSSLVVWLLLSLLFLLAVVVGELIVEALVVVSITTTLVYCSSLWV